LQLCVFYRGVFAGVSSNFSGKKLIANLKIEGTEWDVIGLR